MWSKPQPDIGKDELSAVLGYKEKSSDMAEVAEKLEPLEMAIGTTAEDGVSVLTNDSVRYNPSDLSVWVESMLTELSHSCGFKMVPNEIEISGESSDTKFISFSKDRLIPQDDERFTYNDEDRLIPPE